MRYFEKCVTSGSCLHLTVQKSRLWSYQKVIRLSSLIQSKLLEIIVDYIRGEQLLKFLNFRFQYSIPIGRCKYLSSCVKSTIDIRFLTQFTGMYMKTRHFFRIYASENNHD